MTAYGKTAIPQSSITVAAREAKAKRRQAVLERVRAQRGQTSKKTVAEWVEVGAIFRGSTLKERYQTRSR